MNSTFALYVPLISTKDANLSHHFIGRTRLLSSYTHFSPITTFVNLLPNFCIYYFVSERPPWTNFVNCNVYTQWASGLYREEINPGHLCCPGITPFPIIHTVFCYSHSVPVIHSIFQVEQHIWAGKKTSYITLAPEHV